MAAIADVFVVATTNNMPEAIEWVGLLLCVHFTRLLGVFLHGASVPNDSPLVPHSLPTVTQTQPVSVGNSSKLDAAPSEIARVMATVGIKPLRMLMLIPDYLHLVASNASAVWAWVFIVRFGVIGPDVPTVLTA